MFHHQLILVLVGLNYAASVQKDCLFILEQSQELSATFPKRIAHGIHSLTLADLRHYFNPNANETNNIPTINRNLSSSLPILNDAPDLGRSDRFQTIGLLVAEEVVLNEDKDWDLRNADILDKLLHALHMHEMWMETSRIYKNLISNPPNTDNKRMPRGGRRLKEDDSYVTGHSYSTGSIKPQQIQKRDAPMMIQEDSVATYHSKTYWVNLFNGFAEMTDPISSDLALFLYCMLK